MKILYLDCGMGAAGDMTAEAIAFAMEALLDAGALDVWAAPVTMKKSRPETVLTKIIKGWG